MASIVPTTRRKLIEVAFPSEMVGAASSREMAAFPRFPDTLCHWWPHQPGALCRAALFAAIIDDPAQPDAPEALVQAIDALTISQEADSAWQTLSPGEQRRQKALGFIEQLAQPESLSDERLLTTARALVRAATGDHPPPVYDPFAGSGSIPLEAQRLGLKAYASDLNPVAVLLNRALIDLPARFAGLPLVSVGDSKDAEPSTLSSSWRGARGLAADVRFYGSWMRDEAQRQVGHLFPKIELFLRFGGGEATIAAWIWAGTLICPNPACRRETPLARSFVLDSRKGSKTWIVPRIGDPHSRDEGLLRFDVLSGKGSPPAGTVNQRGARCPFCRTIISHDELRAMGKSDQMSAALMAIVAEGRDGPVHLAPSPSFRRLTPQTKPAWMPDTRLTSNPRCVDLPDYGFTTVASLFTSRQLATLATLSDLINEMRAYVELEAGQRSDRDPAAYADAVATYLALAVCKTADVASSQCRWNVETQQIRPALAQRTLFMNWEYAEGNPFSDSRSGFLHQVQAMARVLEALDPGRAGESVQRDAAELTVAPAARGVVCTEPPHPDSLPLAELSDFFYAWLQPGLSQIHPDLFDALATPKAAELVADPSRHGSVEAAQRFFVERFRIVCECLKEAHDPAYPLILFFPSDRGAGADPAPDETGASDGQRVSVSVDLSTLITILNQAGLTVVAAWDVPLRSRNTTSGNVSSLTILVCRF